ncbi:unnamed protein product [Angiostrongylus costaricensis]|uniref:SCP domain-containing protein n=1 Tax=Angiostrongylus costaricensis TaxID=334426 RepID=A0A0R3Q0G4_ANGCS|nr:unnamed protein product [Angiostrongylus costaricensis]
MEKRILMLKQTSRKHSKNGGTKQRTHIFTRITNTKRQSMNFQIGYMGDSIMWRDGKYCRTSNDCTIFPNSKCEDGLCIKPKQQPDSNKSEMCEGSSGMTDAVRKTFLDTHNFYSCELEQSSTYHAGFCQFSHSSGDYGENIYTVYTPRFEKRVIAEMATESWFEELEDFGVGKNVILTQQLFNRYPGQIGHYTQLVWQETKYVGCGIKECYDKTLVVCQYKKAGNRFNNKIYDVGPPCSKCPSPQRCNKAEGLCFV